MGALFSRLKTWVDAEILTYSDLNAEFNNILDNLTAANVDDFSANTSQMQTTADPGEVGSESLATSVAGEISRLRHLIREITGEDEWYESPTSSLLGLANAIGTGLTNNRIVSGLIRTGTSNQPMVLVPHGAAKTVTVMGSTTNFVYYVNGTEYTISTDVTLTGLTAAPSSNNTCLVNDGNATADPAYTTFTGEDGSTIPVDNMGTEISALVGSFAAFKLAGASTEYFLAYVKSTTELSRASRGYFFDSTNAPVPRSAYTDNDVITLMKLTWIFAKTDGTLTATYTNPIWADDEPSSPALGDYWYDLSANTWKVYGVGSYSTAGAHLIGVCFQDGTNTLGARSFEFFKNYNDLNTMELIYHSATQVKSRHPGATVNVWGETIKADRNFRTWDITLDRDTGVSEAASTTFWCYLTDTGDVKISTVKPYDRREDLRGFYHPYNSWRAIGWFFNNSSQDIVEVDSYFRRYPGLVILPAQTAASNLTLLDEVIPCDSSGGALTKTLPPAAMARGRTFRFIKVSTDFTAVTISTVLSENIISGAVSSATTTINTNGESILLYSNGLAYYLISRNIPSTWTTFTLSMSAVTTPPTKATNKTEIASWRRIGDSLDLNYNYVHTDNTGSAAGSGIYLYTLPNSLSVDNTLISVSVDEDVSVVGSASMSTSADTNAGHCKVYDTTHLSLVIGDADSAWAHHSSTFGAWNSATIDISFAARGIPISGWKG